ncbi:hypothetical protein HOR43_gp33 [Streptomyces phage Ididsumtinwong]|nr:hypothetical protein HOR43_gp33 [Streptomyces phage Ididsumtinwong]APD18524.1 hypothetical protein SEA_IDIDSUMTINWONG_49 [Streptomyces phage Ididsumtinwong]
MTRRTMAARKRHAETRLARRIKFEILLDRADRLSPTEADALREYALAEAATADQLRSTARGQDRTLQRMRDRLAAADAAIVEAEEDRARVEEQLAEARHRIDLLHAVDAGRADGAQRITDERDRAEAFLARLHRAETHRDVLAILGEHRGLTPVAARTAAAFAAAAETQDAVLAEQEREHAVALATEKQRTARAETLLDRARRRLDDLLVAAGRAANQLGTVDPADIADRLYAAIEQAKKDQP